MTNILDDLGGESFPAVDWKTLGLGAVVRGVLKHVPTSPVHLEKTNTDSFPFAIEVDGGEMQTLWVKKPSNLGAMIRKAVRDAGQDTIVEGATLTVKWDREEDTGKPQKARIFKVKYEPPAPSGVNVEDIDF